VNVTLASCLVVGSAITGCGVFALVWRRSLTDALVGIPMIAAGIGICFAGASRFAALRQDPDTGQEMAALVSLVALAWTILAAGWGSRGTSR
jgi:multisubunit Na+/H+ antiporter MnhC subunit